MTDIKILDCTLRDGGYVNNWDFDNKKSQNIINNLINSKIDFVEIGFLKEKSNAPNKTLFNSVDDTKRVTNKANKDKLVLMVMFGEYDIKNLDNARNSSIQNIRFSYKKTDKKEALKQANLIKQKGYNLFINPTYIDQYNDNELIETIKEINDISPYCFSLVDTMGVLEKKDVKKLYDIVNNNLKKETSLGFHSHNNLELSFLNTREIMELCTQRELIIDTSLLGMGRGAGNLYCELMAKYLNDTLSKKYDIDLILKTLREEIYPIFLFSPWGNSNLYYLSAQNKCHPNYAKYFENKKEISDETIDKILKSIPKDKKTIFDENLIRQIYNKFQLSDV